MSPLTSTPSITDSNRTRRWTSAPAGTPISSTRQPSGAGAVRSISCMDPARRPSSRRSSRQGLAAGRRSAMVRGPRDTAPGWFEAAAGMSVLAVGSGVEGRPEPPQQKRGHRRSDQGTRLPDPPREAMGSEGSGLAEVGAGRLDRVEHPLQRRPEVGEPAVDVLVDLRAHARDIGGRLSAELVGAGDGTAVDLGLGDQPLVLGERLGDQGLAVRAALLDQPFGLGLGVGEQPLGLLLGACQQVVALTAGRAEQVVALTLRGAQELLALGARAAGEPLRLGLRLLEDLGALLDDRAGGLDVLGQRLAQVVEQVEQVVARDHAGAGHRHAARVLDDRRQLVDGLVQPVDDLGHEPAPFRTCSSSRSLTALGTSRDTSPPNMATCLTRLDERWPTCGAVGTKSVSMLASSRFIWAICSSYSKSLTARSPLTITGISCARQYSTRSPWKLSMVTFGISATASRSRSIRSSTVNRPAFPGFTSTATTSSSYRPAAREMTST